jgi:stage III sporulation protein AH
LKKIFKKNQVIITALALMIAVAGYLSFTNGSIKDKQVAKEASAKAADDTYEISDENALLEGKIFTDSEDNSVATAANAASSEKSTQTVAQAGKQPGTEAAKGTEVSANPGEAVLTSAAANAVDSAADMKLSREQVRAKNKESLLDIIHNTNIDDAQKKAAVDQMVAMTDIAERESAAEMLLEAKGFTYVVVSITDGTADVVLNMGEATDAKRAQIEDIVKRKTNVTADKIVITPLQEKQQ